jgi:hypothetical protein
LCRIIIYREGSKVASRKTVTKFVDAPVDALPPGADPTNDLGEIGLFITPAGPTFRPAAARRLRGVDREMFDTLTDLGASAWAIRERADQLVPECRKRGVSWALIGWAFGLSESGAKKRWDTP